MDRKPRNIKVTTSTPSNGPPVIEKELLSASDGLEGRGVLLITPPFEGTRGIKGASPILALH
jgi:hypothetical protein